MVTDARYTPAFGYVPPATPDPRNWPVSRLLAMLDAGVAKPVTWHDPVVLDQGQTPHCVGFAGAGYIATQQANSPADPTITNQLGHDLYYECKVVDGTPRVENGSSIHSLMVVLKNRGLIDAYGFATTTDEVTTWLDNYGPVVTGLSWYYGMAFPVNGIMSRTGSIVGGHATLIHGIDSSATRYDIPNSWGLAYGLSGHAYLPIVDFDPLLHMAGEAAMAVKLVAPKYTYTWLDIPAGMEDVAQAVWDSGFFFGKTSTFFDWTGDITADQLALVFQRVCAKYPTKRGDCARMLDWWVKDR